MIHYEIGSSFVKAHDFITQLRPAAVLPITLFILKVYLLNLQLGFQVQILPRSIDAFNNDIGLMSANSYCRLAVRPQLNGAFP